MTNDDRRFLGQFEDCTLPFEQWTHRAHVRVAYLYLSEHPFDEALSRMREGVQHYNATNNAQGLTIQQRLLQIDSIEAVRVADLLPTGNGATPSIGAKIALVQMTSDVIDIPN
mgnify:CR=1 FL=1